MAGNRKTEDERKAALLSELRRQGISDERVLAAITSVPRAEFVAPGLRDCAWKNAALSIPHGQSISQPFVVALMTHALELIENERVLEVGTGSGYQAAILAKLAREVVTIERIPELAATAAERFDTLGLHNVKSIVGDGSRGWEAGAPYDAIIVTAGARQAPLSLFEQLRDDDGRMVIPVGRRFDQHLRLYRKSAGAITSRELCGVRFVPLICDSAERERC